MPRALSGKHPPVIGTDWETDRGDHRRALAATLALLDQRAAGATVCPSEVARALARTDGGTDWRAEMTAVHAAVDRLIADGLIRLSWKGVALARREGPYRIELADPDVPLAVFAGDA